MELHALGEFISSILTEEDEMAQPSPQHAPRRLSIIDLESPGSPSYDQPPSWPTLPVDPGTGLIDPVALSFLDEPPPSRLFFEPSPLDTMFPSPPPPAGTPKWKIDLNERKGLPIQTLSVTRRELEIFARCLTYVQKAIRKGEKCARVVQRMKQLATKMQPEYQQWEQLVVDLENSLSVGERELMLSGSDTEYYGSDDDDDDVDDDNDDDDKHDDDDDDDDNSSMKAEAGYSTFYDPDSTFAGLEVPGSEVSLFGYRKVIPPSSFFSSSHGRRRPFSFITEDEDEDETEDELQHPRRVKIRRDDPDDTEEEEEEEEEEYDEWGHLTDYGRRIHAKSGAQEDDDDGEEEGKKHRDKRARMGSVDLSGEMEGVEEFADAAAAAADADDEYDGDDEKKKRARRLKAPVGKRTIGLYGQEL